MAEDVFRSLTFHAGCPKYVSPLVLFPAFPHLSQLVKNLPAVQETQVQSLSREYPLEKGMAPHSNILAWRIHGQRSLADYSPWSRKELDTTEQLTLSLSFSLRILDRKDSSLPKIYI